MKACAAKEREETSQMNTTHGGLGDIEEWHEAQTRIEQMRQMRRTIAARISRGHLPGGMQESDGNMSPYSANIGAQLAEAATEGSKPQGTNMGQDLGWSWAPPTSLRS